MFTAADLQKAKLSKVDIIETDKNGKKTIVSKTGERISTLEGTSAGFVVDTKPDPQLARVMDNLFVGSQDSTQNLLGCEENKITHVLNLVEGISPAFPDKFTYRTIPILDVEESGLDEVLGDCFEFIDNAINNGGSCLVHCNAGVSRSCSVVLVVLFF